MPQKETYLVTRDVAHILNCSPDDVSVIAKQGKLKGIAYSSEVGH